MSKKEKALNKIFQVSADHNLLKRSLSGALNTRKTKNNKVVIKEAINKEQNEILIKHIEEKKYNTPHKTPRLYGLSSRSIRINMMNKNAGHLNKHTKSRAAGIKLMGLLPQIFDSYSKS